MNLLFIVGYDLHRSPWATRPRAILKEIVHRGHRVTVVDLEEPRKRHAPIHPPLEPQNGLELLHLKQRYFIPLDSPIALWKAAEKVAPFLRQADLVHIQKPKLLTWAIGRWATALGKPLVYDWDDLEGSGGVRSGLSARKVEWMERFFACESSAIVAASRELERLIQKKHPEHAPLYYGPCGVDTGMFNPNAIPAEKTEAWRNRLGLKDQRVILYHGQLEMGHPGSLLLDALEDVRSRHPVKLLLIGGGKIQKKLCAEASRRGLQEHLVSTGYVPFEEIPTLLSLADAAIILLPDTPYGRCKSPLKLYEAMSMGLPVIASNVGQAADVLQSIGILIPPDSKEALAEALDKVFYQPAEARLLGQAAREQALKRHRWTDLAKTFINLYETLASRTARNARR